MADTQTVVGIPVQSHMKKMPTPPFLTDQYLSDIIMYKAYKLHN